MKNFFIFLFVSFVLTFLICAGLDLCVGNAFRWDNDLWCAGGGCLISCLCVGLLRVLTGEWVRL
jgi:hypothetical protein